MRETSQPLRNFRVGVEVTRAQLREWMNMKNCTGKRFSARLVKKLDCESCEVAREIQPVKNERTVLPTPENVNGIEDWGLPIGDFRLASFATCESAIAKIATARSRTAQ